VELGPLGLTIVTVALDTDVEAARPFHEAANPTHPSLVDQSHRLVELFGITNVPFGLWVDETGTIVRPPEVAFLAREPRPGDPSPEEARERMLAQIPPERRAVVEAMTRNSSEADRARYEELRDGQVHRWADLVMKDIEQAGQQEFLNWICLGGALAELRYTPNIIDFIQTYIFNSSKCFMTARA